MNSGDRFRALVLVWGAFVAIVGLTFLEKASIGLGELILGAFFSLAVMVATIFITTAKSEVKEELGAREASKLKRDETSIIERLVDSMDQDERAALIKRLSVQETFVLGDDGEIRNRR